MEACLGRWAFGAFLKKARGKGNFLNSFITTGYTQNPLTFSPFDYYSYNYEKI